MELMFHQRNARNNLRNGNILYGIPGSGKSATALGYYVENESPKHIYIITTAKKRDSLDWEKEAAKFGIGTQDWATCHGIITVDSWSKISWYEDIQDAFFIFDEQRVVGHGSWVKSFIKIARKNHWILLSATPGDQWVDYAAVFVANGFYKNLTDFRRKHIVLEPYLKFPKIKYYLNETKLEMLRNEILVEMPFQNDVERWVNYIDVGYNKELVNKIYKERWNIFDNRPVKDATEMFRLMRRVVNSDPSRIENIVWLMKTHPRLIVFYNFNYELEILRTLNDQIEVFEWNGHKKDVLPDSDKCDSDRWVYLVQYIAGAEGWNCTSTDSMVLYSLTYSYKNFVQAQGRIDRLDTEYKKLFYYVFVSNSKIDEGIKKALKGKRSFNERAFMAEMMKNEFF